MKKLFFGNLYTLFLILLIGCQTVSNKIDETTTKEEVELSKWLNKSEEAIKSFYGQPDKIEFLKNIIHSLVHSALTEIRIAKIPVALGLPSGPACLACWTFLALSTACLGLSTACPGLQGASWTNWTPSERQVGLPKRLPVSTYVF